MKEETNIQEERRGGRRERGLISGRFPPYIKTASPKPDIIRQIQQIQHQRQIQIDTILAPGRCLAHWHQPGPLFSHPRPIDRFLRPARCLVDITLAAPSSTHRPSDPLIGISTVLPFFCSGTANHPVRWLVLFPWLGEHGLVLTLHRGSTCRHRVTGLQKKKGPTHVRTLGG